MASQLRLTLADPPAATVAPKVRNQALFEAGSHTRRTLGWRAPTSSPNHGILNSLATLRDRSRAAVRNDGYAKGAIDALVRNIIGTGITPLSKAQDLAFRQTVTATWLRWTDESDADGLLDWYGQQGQAARGMFEGGEMFLRRRPRRPEDGLSVPLQIQVLEPELCPHTYTTTLSNGHRVRAGIEFDGIGRRRAYWFTPSRPDLPDFAYGLDTSRLRRVPAEDVIHLYEPLRAGQLRGLPKLTQALVSLHEMGKYSDAALLRQQLSNMLVGFITRDGSLQDASLDPMTGEPIDTSQGEPPMISFEPGTFQALEPGEDVTFSDPPEARGFADFMRQHLYNVAAAVGVPYEVLTGDMNRVNDRTVRVILHEFRRGIQQYQHQIFAHQVCRRVWAWWFDAAFVSGALPLGLDYVEAPTRFTAVRWMPQRWPYLHPVQDVTAAKMEVRAGFTSRATVVSELGEDVATIDAEQAADNQRADELGLEYDSDARSSAPPTTVEPEEATT